MDVKLMSALMQLGGNNAAGANLKKAEKIINTLCKISQNGMDYQMMLQLLSELNPQIRPLVTIITKLYENAKPINCQSDAQYCNFRHF